MADLNFEDLAPKSVTLTLGVPKGSSPTHRLWSASADAARQFRNSQFKSTVITEDKDTKIGNLADSETVLVSQCLQTIDGKPVELSTIRTWDYTVTKALYEQIREMSPSLDEKDTAESLEKQIAKLQKKLAELKKSADPNPSGAGTDTSA